MAEAAGEENFFLFGLTADQVIESRGYYNPQWHYEHDVETRAALDLIGSNHFSAYEPGVFDPILSTLHKGDHYLHLADLMSYSEAHARLAELYADQERWAQKVILNIAGSGRFSSDRTIADYAREIWNVKPCPVE
jgi:starch phosphorylase